MSEDLEKALPRRRPAGRRRPLINMAMRRRWRRLWLVTGAVGIALGLAYQLAARNSPRPIVVAASASAGTLHLMSELGPIFAGDLVALRAGLFERQGLHLELKPGSGADDPIKAVTEGVDTFGVTRADSFLLARANGAPIVAFAAAYIESPAVFYALKSSGLRNPAEFVGRRVGVRAEDETEIIYRAMVAKLGLPSSRITEVPVTDDLGLLLRGDVDVWPGHVGIEDVALRRSAVDYVAIDPGSYGIHLLGSVYFATERTVAGRAQLVQRFLNATVAGWESAYADYAQIIPMIASFDAARLTPEYIRATLDRQREYLRPAAVRFGEFNSAQWRSLRDILAAQRLLAQPVDLSRAVTYDFLREAYRAPLSFGK